MSENRKELPAWLRSSWIKWSWLIVAAVIIVQSLDYHWRRVPTSADGYFARGRSDYQEADYDSAIVNLTKSIEMKPEDADSYALRGEAYAKRREFSLAMADLEKAAALRPDYDKSHAALADGRAAVWDAAGAIAEYGRAIEINPRYARCYLERGKLRYGAQDWAAAADDFRRAAGTSLKETLGTAELLLWAARARAGEAAAATADLAHILSIGWAHGARFEAGAQLLTGRLDEPTYLAGASAVKTDDKDEILAEAFFLAGAKRIAAGDHPGAMALFRASLGTDADTSYAYQLALVELTREMVGARFARLDDVRAKRLGLSPDTGLVIASVEPDGPLAAAGLAPGAVVAAIDGKDLGQQDLGTWVARAQPGGTAALAVVDGAGARAALTVALRPGSSSPTR
jgi:Tfp pilus assembly protein PilF